MKKKIIDASNSPGDAGKLLDSFDARVRREALARLAANAPHVPERNMVNMHAHSFFSYNSRGFSPSHIAWEARNAGLYAAGLCDFDVLDGLDEFLDAGLALGLRTAVNIETRAFLSEFAQVDINSPGEPGVTYVMGAGFARKPAPGTPQGDGLARLKNQASERNAALVKRINARLPDIAVDYECEVLPLSPGACPTERHIVNAYIAAAETRMPDAGKRAGFWAATLKRPSDAMPALASNRPAMEEAVRSALVKRGGLGYETPTQKTFPPVDDFFKWVSDCRAIPMAAWLDGASAGEQDMRAMLECLKAKGVAAVNLIPDRNHNIADPKVKSVKTQKLGEVIEAAEELRMPINIGTEMNKDGQPFFDDLAAPALARHSELFLAGARIMVGHTRLLRYADYSYAGAESAAEFGANLSRKNKFFESIGGLPPLRVEQAGRLDKAGHEKAFALLADSAARGHWLV